MSNKLHKQRRAARKACYKLLPKTDDGKRVPWVRHLVRIHPNEAVAALKGAMASSCAMFGVDSSLGSCFVWEETPQGHDFWREVAVASGGW